jgi:hypothetical protein
MGPFFTSLKRQRRISIESKFLRWRFRLVKIHPEMRPTILGAAAMDDIESMIREYCELLDQERRLGDRKDVVKAAILAKMNEANLATSRTPSGNVERVSRFKLTPRRDDVLTLLDAEDLFPFAQFTPTRVKEHLIPRYGRERLLPLFDVEKTVFVMVKRPPGSLRPPSESSRT